MKVWKLEMGEEWGGADRVTLCACYEVAKRKAGEWIQVATWPDEWKWDGDFRAEGAYEWISITEVEVLTD